MLLVVAVLEAGGSDSSGWRQRGVQSHVGVLLRLRKDGAVTSCLAEPSVLCRLTAVFFFFFLLTYFCGVL